LQTNKNTTGMTAKHLLEFIKRKAKKEASEIVIDHPNTGTVAFVVSFFDERKKNNRLHRNAGRCFQTIKFETFVADCRRSRCFCNSTFFFFPFE
jgi:hypothetical protein